jgi:hypothetical protein
MLCRSGSPSLLLDSLPLSDTGGEHSRQSERHSGVGVPGPPLLDHLPIPPPHPWLSVERLSRVRHVEASLSEGSLDSHRG